MKQLSQEEVIQLLKKKQGSRPARELAEELGITPQYLSDIYLGRRDPGPAVIEALGLSRRTVYEKQSQAAD